MSLVQNVGWLVGADSLGSSADSGNAALWGELHEADRARALVPTPGCVTILKCTQVAFMALSLPLGMQLIFLPEYSHLNPLFPAQYYRLLVKAWCAILENDGKVTNKCLLRNQVLHLRLADFD